METLTDYRLIAAPFTPMLPDGQLALDRVPPLVEALHAAGISGIFVCGSTGEGPSLTHHERKSVAEAFVRAASGKLRVFVHVGHNSVFEARELAQHAQAIGADAVSATIPTYYPIAEQRALLATVSHIAGGAPGLPFYYYFIPRLTGLRLDTAEFIDLARAAIPNLRGIKYTSADIHNFQYCLDRHGELDILYGQDEMMLSALTVGATGFIGSTYNFAAPQYHRLLTHYEDGNLAAAREDQLGIVAMVRAINRYGGLAAQKAMMKMIGLDCGPVRPPLMPLSEAAYVAFRAELEGIGFPTLAPRVTIQLDAQRH